MHIVAHKVHFVDEFNEGYKLQEQDLDEERVFPLPFTIVMFESMNSGTVKSRLLETTIRTFLLTMESSW